MQQINEQHYPSKVIGYVHSVLLSIITVIFAVVLIFTLIYYFDIETYVTYILNIDQAVSTFGSLLYYVTLVTFLVWIIRVHQAIQQRYADYPITVGGGIIRMIPIINIWGLGSTFSTIGDYLNRNSAIQRTASHIPRLIVPLYIAVFGTNYVNRILLRNPESITPDMILLSSILDVASLVVYLWLTIVITKSVRGLYANVTTDHSGIQEQVESHESQSVNTDSNQTTVEN